MVKQSRRQVKKRSMRRRTAKVGGGAYKGNDGVFLRRERASGFGRLGFGDISILYELTVRTDENNKYYILDFTKASLGKLVGLAAGPSKYITILKEAFKVTDETNAAVISGMINALFDGGNDKAKTRILKITKPLQGGDNTIELMLSSSPDKSILTGIISTPGDIDAFFQSIDDNRLIASQQV